MKLILTVSAIFIFNNHNLFAQNPSHAQMNIRKIIVEEVLQTTNYTYLFGEVKGEKTWVALPKTEAKAGDEYYYKQGIEMRDFKSQELNRTFDVIWFIGGVESAEAVTGDAGKTQNIAQNSMQSDPHKMKSGRVTTKIKPDAGGITIAELLENKEKLEGKKVKLKGQVVKYNDNIMGKNWIHLQDGTDYSGVYDITLTSGMETQVGDIISVEGIVILDKDFGFGYFFDILIEDCIIK